MPRDFYEAVIGTPDASGVFTVYSGVQVTVVMRGTSNLATVYQRETGVAQGPSPEAGATGGPNPFFLGTSGSVQFWCDSPDRYDILVHDPIAPSRVGDRTIQWNAIALDDIPEASLAQEILDAIVPIGGQMPYTGDTDPSGGRFLLCDGRLVNVADYPVFATKTGHKYNGGVDPGGGQIRIPDKRGRGSLGADNMGTARGAAGRVPSIPSGLRSAGWNGGADTHTHTANIPSHTHSGALPSHTHTGGCPDHLHSVGSLYTGNHSHGVSVSGTTGGSNSNTAGGVGSGGYASCAYWNHAHGVNSSGGTDTAGNLGIGGATGAADRSLAFTTSGPSAATVVTGGPSVTAMTTDAGSTLAPYEIDNYIVRMK
jgi:Phage Tail Collar Domain